MFKCATDKPKMSKVKIKKIILYKEKNRIEKKTLTLLYSVMSNLIKKF